MKSTLAIAIAVLACCTLHAEHSEEPEYGYYHVFGGGVDVFYNKDGESIWHIPESDSRYTHPNLNAEGMEIRFNPRCWSHASDSVAYSTYLSFGIDTSYDLSSFELDERVIFRFDTRIVKKKLPNHNSTFRWFSITDNQYATSHTNRIIDEDLMKDVMKELFKRGRITVEAVVNDEKVKNIIVARPDPHISKKIFATISRCYYGTMHPYVTTSNSGIQSMLSSSFNDLNAFAKQANTHEEQRMKEFQLK